ncbi:MAG: bifunctional metallophosphatase/5'-nucleotidase [Lachnospiraceae bacterium]|nr:bifunctional metallophosphatase/5'-nucleotidase [Lachnospiraceae bacterium]
MKKKGCRIWLAGLLAAVLLSGCAADGKNQATGDMSKESSVTELTSVSTGVQESGKEATGAQGSGEEAAGAQESGEDAGETKGSESTEGSKAADGSKTTCQGASRNGGLTDTETKGKSNGEIYVLYTSDVHCGIDQGFGYAGLAQVRKALEDQGYETILVDNGDAVQGEMIGMLTQGEAILDIMNALEYDVAVPGNHECDYGMERFFELRKMASFPYVSCNLCYKGEPILQPYVIREVAGKKIAFVGVTAPNTLTQSTPKFFQDENGNFVYDFLNDTTGEKVYAAVQKAVDDARGEGADLVYLLGHLGMHAEDQPWTYADVLANTYGIDVMFDGHSHDSAQVEMKNKKGEKVFRSACGTKLSSIGYSHISADGTILETGIWNWNNGVSLPKLLGIENEVGDMVKEATASIQDLLDQVVAKSDCKLTIYDPESMDSAGKLIRMVRRAETNLGDFCADAIRSIAGADVALMNGGGIRADLPSGDITYGDLTKVHPYGNQICLIKATGQEILDALEWGARAVPDENGGFLQVSGMHYEVDASVPNPCQQNENGMMTGIKGKRRVKNIYVGEEPIDPKKTYTVAGVGYTLLFGGDGYTAFNNAEVVAAEMQLDVQVLIDYVTNELGGKIDSATYGDAYGQGRITILDEE